MCIRWVSSLAFMSSVELVLKAVNANTPIMGSQGVPYEEGGKIWHAKDIGLINQTCYWMPAC